MGDMVTANYVKGVVTYPPLPPMDQVEDSQFVLLWGDRAVTPHRRGVRQLYRHPVLSSMQFWYPISCTGNHTMWDLSRHFRCRDLLVSELLCVFAVSSPSPTPLPASKVHLLWSVSAAQVAAVLCANTLEMPTRPTWTSAASSCVVERRCMWSHDSHVTSSRALCGPPAHPEVLSDQYWGMRVSGLTTCLCLLFLLCALLTRVVCAHAPVFTSVSHSKTFSDFVCQYVVATYVSLYHPHSPPTPLITLP